MKTLIVTLILMFTNQVLATQFVCHPKDKRDAIQITYEFMNRVRISNKGYRLEPGVFLLESGQLGGILKNKFNTDSVLGNEIGARKVSVSLANDEHYQAEFEKSVFDATFVQNSIPTNLDKVVLTITSQKISDYDKSYTMTLSADMDSENSFLQLKCERISP